MARPNENDPIIEQWYWHLDKGPGFYVTAIDEEARTIEVQHYDGDIEEYTFPEWRNLDVEVGEEPENWTGALDIGELDDLGTEITDTEAADWSEPLKEFRSDTRDSDNDTGTDNDDYGEGHMEETPLDGEDAEITGPPTLIDTTSVIKRPDGLYEEVLSDIWSAEYSEEADSGLWQVTLFKHDVPEWREGEFDSLDDAVAAARNYYDEI